MKTKLKTCWARPSLWSDFQRGTILDSYGDTFCVNVGGTTYYSITRDGVLLETDKMYHILEVMNR